MPTPGQTLLRIADAGALEIDLIVRSVWLEPAAPLQVKVDETGTTYGARVIRTAAAVDSVSRTITITAAFAGSDTSAICWRAGQSKTANTYIIEIKR